MNKRQFTNKWIRERAGALPSGWDPESIYYQVVPATTVEAELLPGEYDDLREYCPDNVRFDQGNVGSCVGWDYNGIIETQHTLLSLYNPRTTYVLTDLSAGWIYHFSRKYSIPPVPDSTEGSTNFGACKALHKMGVALESDVPTDTASPWDGIKDAPEIRTKALGYRISSYHNITPDPTSIKAAIYGLTFELPYDMPDGSPGKTPVASAYPIHNSFRESYDDGIVPMPGPNDRLLGGHSSMIIGWKVIDGREYFINYNSWGEDVGDEGVFYIPIDYPFYPNDWWLVNLIPTSPNPETTTIINQPHWILPLANLLASDPAKFYYGVETK